MNLTPHQAKYFAYELTKRCSADSIEKLAGALVDAQVDLNPHQVEAALFAFHSPLSKYDFGHGYSATNLELFRQFFLAHGVGLERGKPAFR